MNLKLSSIPALFCALCASALGQIAFTGTYTPPSTGNTETTLAYNGTAVSNLTISPLAKVGITSTSSGNGFRGSNWPLGGANGSDVFTGAIDTTKYIEFTLTAATDYAIELSTLTFGVGRSGTGPRQWEWRSSVDSYTAPLTAYSTRSAGATNPTSGVLQVPDTTAGWTGNVLDLSALNNVTTITFRLYGYNADGTGGTGGILGALTFAGNVVYTGAVATGTTWTGTGVASTWQNAATGHFDGTYTNSLTNLVTFGGTGEAVTLAGTVQAGDVTVSTTGFTFGGSALELGKGTILTAVDTLTVIDSVITGTAGMKKEGPGQLTLNAANTFTGGLFVNGGILAISAENELGDAANTITLNSGTLALEGSFSLGAGHTLAGTGTISLPSTTNTLTISGPVNAGSLTFTNGDLIELANANNAANGLTLNDIATFTVSGGELALSGNLTVNTTGITALNGPINFTGFTTRTISVPNGSLRPTGTFTTGTYVVKTGAGTLNLTGTAAAITGLQVGIAGTTTAGTIIVDDAGDLGVSPNQIRLNYGTLQLSQPIVSATGFSVGGRESALATISGSNLELQGLSSFFTGNGTSGQLHLVVNNTTTLSGTVGATGTGGGSSTGLTLGGTGKLIITGNALSFDQAITLNNSVTLNVANQLGGGGITVASGTVLELNGATVLGTLTVNAGGIVRITGTNSINGAIVNDGVIEIDGASTTFTINNTVTNNAGASIELLNGATLVADVGFTNEGILDLSGAASTQMTPAGITGGGTIIPVGGTIVIPSTTLALSGGQATVTFASQSGRTYQLQVTTDLATTPIVWTNVGSAVSGTGSTLVLTDAAPPTSAKVFYRVVIE